MLRSVETKRAVHGEIGRHFVSFHLRHRIVGAEIDGEHDGPPAELRQMLRKAQRTLHTAAALQRRKMKRDQQHRSVASDPGRNEFRRLGHDEVSAELSSYTVTAARLPSAHLTNPEANRAPRLWLGFSTHRVKKCDPLQAGRRA